MEMPSERAAWIVVRCVRIAMMAALFFSASSLAADDAPQKVLCVRNRVLIPVSINDVKPFYMLLDLALPHPVIGNEIVTHLQLEPAAEEATDVRRVAVRALQYDNRRATSETCVATDLAPLSGMLGMTVAGIVNPREFGSEMVMDVARGIFEIHGATDASIQDAKDPKTVKMSVTGDRPMVSVTLNGSTIRPGILDTTFGGTLAVSESLLGELGTSLESIPKLLARSIPGVAEAPVGRVQVRLKSVRLGAAEIREPLCVVETGDTPVRLGVGFFKRFCTTLNFERGLACWDAGSVEPIADEPIVGCGLGLALFQSGHWMVWVAADSPADRAGIAPGSVLMDVNGKDMADVSYSDASSALPSEEGKEAAITVWHDSESRTVTLRAEKLL